MTTKPDLTRVWAASAPGSNVVDPDVSAPGKYASGWVAEKPPYENFNYLQKQFSGGLAHINENGICVWDANTSYPVGGVVKGSDDVWYIAKVAQSGNDPVSDPVNWGKFFTNYADVKGGRKNLLINGNFDIWQRGTSFTGVTEYTADMWVMGSLGTTHTTSSQNFTLGQTEVPGSPSYYIQAAVSSVAGAGNYYNLIQRIEGVETLSGQDFVLTFYAKADSVKNIAIEINQHFGTGGSPAASVSSNVNTVTLSTGFQKITIKGTVPSVSGKTLGTNNDDYIEVVFWFDAGSNWNSRTNSLGQQSGTFSISQVQMEAGAEGTTFERLSFSETLTGCQRYYCVGTLRSRIDPFPSAAGHFSEFPVRMRAIPTITASAVFGTLQGFTALDDNSVFFEYSAGGASGNFWCSYTADASLN